MGAARTLARAWLRDAWRWTLASSLVLAGTLVLMLGTSGVLQGTQDETLHQVSDFYTGDLRITRDRAGALPTSWFQLNETGTGGAKELASDPNVSARVEGQFIASRRGLVEAAIYEHGQFPVDAPGSSADATKLLAIGSLVGLDSNDPSWSRIEAHMTAGRRPQPTGDGSVEVVMSLDRLDRFLTPAERRAAADVPRIDVARALTFEVTSAQVDESGPRRDVIRRTMHVVGLYETGVDLLDGTTLVASSTQVRQLLGRGGAEPIANALLVWGDTGHATDLAKQRNWVAEGDLSFAKNYVGELLAILSAVVILVAVLMFLIPTFLVSHGLARQLASQQRELAVCTAIGIPDSVLRRALLWQVAQIGIVGAGTAALVIALAAWLLPGALRGLTWMPLPLGFGLTWLLAAEAVVVTLGALAIGWAIGFRGRSRLPLSAQLRSS